MSGRLKTIDQARYERLCREGCDNPKLPERGETEEDAYWWSVCREVYRYLGAHFMFKPVEGASRGDVYRHNLLQLVARQQTTPFNVLAIADKYIKEAMADEGDEGDE